MTLETDGYHVTREIEAAALDEPAHMLDGPGRPWTSRRTCWTSRSWTSRSPEGALGYQCNGCADMEERGW
jgi:hypothetical protein